MRLGAAPVVVASLLITVRPAQGDGEMFTLRLWADAAGAVRLRAQKLDVDFLEALVEPDGLYRAWLPREAVATKGRLGGAEDPPLLRDLSLLLGEVRSGPLPPGVVVAAGADGAWTWADGPTAVTLAFGADGLPSGKRIATPDGVELRRLGYARWNIFEGLQRPSAVELHVAGDDAVYAVRLKNLDTPPQISNERMHLTVPDDVVWIDAPGFAARMGMPGPPPRP
jgi:hypothetical protein